MIVTFVAYKCVIFLYQKKAPDKLQKDTSSKANEGYASLS